MEQMTAEMSQIKAKEAQHDAIVAGLQRKIQDSDRIISYLNKQVSLEAMRGVNVLGSPSENSPPSFRKYSPETLAGKESATQRVY